MVAVTNPLLSALLDPQESWEGCATGTRDAMQDSGVLFAVALDEFFEVLACFRDVLP